MGGRLQATLNYSLPKLYTMCCCSSSQLFPFTAVATSSIPWTLQMPGVIVSYLQDDGSYIQSGVFTQVRITGTSIDVDHGGTASGIIKIIP